MKISKCGPANFILSALLLASGIAANAQSLPAKQTVSLRAPADIKIDGEITEWDNKFQAFNNVVDVFYTIANDDDNLYFVIQATRPEIIQKIIKGGITFTINYTGKKKNKDEIAITYPMYDKKEKPLFLILDNKPPETPDPGRNKFQAYSFMNALNKQITDKFRSIGLVNGKAKVDTILSIYNVEGIKAACLLDSKLNYHLEMAVPLKYMGMGMDKAVKFNYNIKLNGASHGNSQINVISSPLHGDILFYVGGDGKEYMIGESTPENLVLAYPTDFWGEYTLAKQ